MDGALAFLPVARLSTRAGFLSLLGGRSLLLLAAMVWALTFLEDGNDGRDACKAPC